MKLKKLNFEIFDLVYALENAAEFLETEQWPEDDGGKQHAANDYAAKLIRKLAEKYGNKL